MAFLEDFTGIYCSFLRKKQNYQINQQKISTKVCNSKRILKRCPYSPYFLNFLFLLTTICFKSWIHTQETKYNISNYQFWKIQCFETNFISLPHIWLCNWFQVEAFSSQFFCRSFQIFYTKLYFVENELFVFL